LDSIGISAETKGGALWKFLFLKNYSGYGYI